MSLKSDTFKASINLFELIMSKSEIKQESVILKDGVLFAKSHMDLIPLKLEYENNNLLIIIPNDVNNEDDLEDISFLKWNQYNGWWVNIPKSNFNSNMDINYINKLKYQKDTTRIFKKFW